MESAITRVPSFKRVKSRGEAKREVNTLGAQDHDILALILMELPISSRANFFQTCTNFNSLYSLERELGQEGMNMVRDKWNVAKRVRDEQVARERNDVAKAMCAAILLALLSFITQAGVGALFIYTADRTTRLYPGCELTGVLETSGWCGVIAWAMGLVAQLVLHADSVSRTLCGAASSVKSVVAPPRPDFDIDGQHAMEMGAEPLLEEQAWEGEEEVEDEFVAVPLGQRPSLLGLLVITQCFAATCGFINFYCGISIWQLIHYGKGDELKDQCGDWAYGVSWWCVYLIWCIVFSMWGLICLCMCCIPIFMMMRR